MTTMAMTRPNAWVAYYEKITRGDVAYVRCITERDATSIHYEVRFGSRKLLEHAYQEGEGEYCVWHACVVFGQTDATVAGGAAFVEAARRQDEVAGKVWARGAA